MRKTPPIPAGRLDGGSFFAVGEKTFGYVSDQPKDGYSGSRPEVWFRAWNYAVEIGATEIEERTQMRLNDYVGPGVYGLNYDRNGNLTRNLLSGRREYGASLLLATTNLR
jgi:hypothetical protein